MAAGRCSPSLRRSGKAPDRPARVVFLDDGGVLNDNERRAVEWRRYVPEFFIPRLGGTADAWSEANRVVALESWHRYLAHMAVATQGVEPYLREADRRWLRDMCSLVGVPGPLPDEIDDLVTAAQRYACERCRSAYPDVIGAVFLLAREGLALHTASGETSAQLAAYLRGMGVRDCFDRLYGTDLVDRFKCGPAYYAAIVADSGVDPHEAVVVDDSPEALGWAEACGLRPIHLDRAGRGSTFERITTLAELPLLLGV